MIWLLFLLVICAVLGTLEIGTNVTLPNEDLVFLLEDNTKLWLGILALGCAFLCSKFNQFSRSNLIVKSLSILAQIGLVLVIVLFFVLRSLMDEYDFAKITPTQSYTITADVMIDEISDSFYSKQYGVNYRQKAYISNLKYVENTSQYAHESAKFDNPFFLENSNKSSHTNRPKLPSNMTVLLLANSGGKSDLSKVNDLKPNTKTTMTLSITPIARNKSVLGFDGYRWLKSRHIHANAKVLSVGDIEQAGLNVLKTNLQSARQMIREHFLQKWQNLNPDKQQANALTLSLLTGDRALINKDTKALYQYTGIMHLLAISGTHVVFLAIILSKMMTWMTDRYVNIYNRISRQSISLLVMISASFVYALFTGFDVPAVRTVYMLIAVSCVRVLAIPVSSLRVLVVVALVMIWFEPVLVWQAGFWLSFVAVVLLMCFDADEFGFKNQDNQNPMDKLIEIAKLQTYMFVTMLPLSILLFGKISLWGLVINLFAVGLFGAVIVPINLLAGVVFMINQSFADVIWWIDTTILGVLNDFLMMIYESSPNAWIYQSTGLAGLLLLTLSILPFVMPFIGKKYGVVAFMAFMMTSAKTPILPDELSVRVLPSDYANIAQVLITQRDADNSTDRTSNWLFLSHYDNQMDVKNYANTLVEQLHRQKINHLTGVVIQTPSLQMAEVVEMLNKEMPIHRYWQAGNLPTSSSLAVQSCTADRQWQGDGLEISAITGWQQIKDEKIWGCSIQIKSKFTLQINGGIEYAKTADAVFLNKNRADGIKSEIVISGAMDAKTWQIYDMMCKTTETGRISPDLWISNLANHDETALLNTDYQKLVFSNQDTPKNQDKIQNLSILSDMD